MRASRNALLHAAIILGGGSTFALRGFASIQDAGSGTSTPENILQSAFNVAPHSGDIVLAFAAGNSNDGDNPIVIGNSAQVPQIPTFTPAVGLTGAGGGVNAVGGLRTATGSEPTYTWGTGGGDTYDLSILALAFANCTGVRTASSANTAANNWAGPAVTPGATTDYLLSVLIGQTSGTPAFVAPAGMSLLASKVSSGVGSGFKMFIAVAGVQLTSTSLTAAPSWASSTGFVAGNCGASTLLLTHS